MICCVEIGALKVPSVLVTTTIPSLQPSHEVKIAKTFQSCIQALNNLFPTMLVEKSMSLLRSSLPLAVSSWSHCHIFPRERRA